MLKRKCLNNYPVKTVANLWPKCCVICSSLQILVYWMNWPFWRLCFMLILSLIVVQTLLTFLVFISPSVGIGSLVLLQGGGGDSDLWGQGLQGILYCMMTERGIRWVRYHSVFWSRLSEVNSQWPWGLGSEEKRGGGERVSRGQGWLRGLLGWFLIAAERFGLPALQKMLTQEIGGLGFPFSHELLLHTASFFHFCWSFFRRN